MVIVVNTPVGLTPAADDAQSIQVATTARPRLSASWTSWTGVDSWTLTDSSSPVFALQGTTGLRGAEVNHFWTDAPAIDGSSWDGVRIGRGEIFMPTRISADDLDTYLAVHAAFDRSLDPRKEGVLRITRPDSQWREISCRYVSGMDAAVEPDPVLVRRATYGLTFATADPYWRGETIWEPFDYEVPADLFPGPPFPINAGQSLADAKVTNPGDVESAAVWRANGPFTGFSVGLADGSGVVSMTLTKPAGGWVEIDMNPRKLTMVDETGADCWIYATSADFSPIPAGSDIPLTTSVLGAALGTSVSLSFTPKYRSGW